LLFFTLFGEEENKSRCKKAKEGVYKRSVILYSQTVVILMWLLAKCLREGCRFLKEE